MSMSVKTILNGFKRKLPTLPQQQAVPPKAYTQTINQLQALGTRKFNLPPGTPFCVVRRAYQLHNMEARTKVLTNITPGEISQKALAAAEDAKKKIVDKLGLSHVLSLKHLHHAISDTQTAAELPENSFFTTCNDLFIKNSKMQNGTGL